MINLYSGKTTSFTTNGIIMNEWVDLKVTEILNGEYSIKGTYPITDSMKYLELVKGSIIYAPTPSGNQPFRIYTVDKELQEVTVEGFHVFYDLGSNMLPEGFYVKGSGDTAMKQMLEACENEHPFTASSDIKEVHQYSTGEDTNPLLVLFKDKHCLTYTYSGEVHRDCFHIALKDRLGEDTFVKISYGKNLLSFKNNSSHDSVITRIKVAYKKTLQDSKGNEIVYTLKTVVDSPLINEYPVIYSKSITIEDMDSSFDFQNEDELASFVSSYYYEENNVDKPRFSVSVDWIKEHDYETLKLGDTALILHEQYDFEYRLKITKYIYDCILEDYDELYFGDLEGQIESVVTEQGTSLDGLTTAISNHTTNIYELNKRLYDLENPIYYPNAVYNSNFGRFNEDLKPDFWDTTGNVTTAEHLIGQYSLRLHAGEYAKIKDKPIQAYKWEEKSTNFLFRVIGEGQIKVQVLADTTPQEIFSYVNNIYTSKKEFIFNISTSTWFDSKCAVELHPCRKTVALKIECISGTVYIDGVQVVPIEQGSRLDIQYTDGAMCYNDAMQYRTDDLLDAKVGDMWFRGDL